MHHFLGDQTQARSMATEPMIRILVESSRKPSLEPILHLNILDIVSGQSLRDFARFSDSKPHRSLRPWIRIKPLSVLSVQDLN